MDGIVCDRKKVCVLLSTYNGERYLDEQLNSLAVQKDVELKVLIRDDGSKDQTLHILDAWAQKDKRFSYYYDVNKGPAKSFLDLIVNSPDADYYAFCDQDDVWDEDKLAVAVKYLEKENKNSANMYYSNLKIVDQNLKFLYMSHQSPSPRRKKYSCLTEDVVTGCTMVFNAKAREYVMYGIPNYCTMHDTWLYMICKFFGTVIYDFDAHILYRQHGNNVVGAYQGKSKFMRYGESFKRIFDRKLQPRYNNAISFLEIYEPYLSEQDKIKLKIFVEYKDSFFKKMRLLFDKDIHATSRKRDLRYRGLIILGIL